MKLAAWANQEHVRRYSRELCAGTATIVARQWERQALVALTWLWTPVSPHHVVRTVPQGVTFCLSSLIARGVRLPASPDTLRADIERTLRAEGVAGAEHLAPDSARPPRAASADLREPQGADGWIGVGASNAVPRRRGTR
jgi:hypothetical protein